ncbi:MAG: PAS domain S-box protein [Planctomycetales bacterium]|nr:PAS domain S-box protein [Planctomycetales bacterium]
MRVSQMDESHPINQSGSLRTRAEALLNAMPDEMPTVSTKDVQALVHELTVYQMELEIQNEDLRDAQVRLAHTRDRYADLYEFAPVGYVTLNRDGLILEANLTAATMLGADRQKLLQSPLSNFITRESQDACYLHRQRVFSSDSKQVTEIEMLKVDGTRLFARLESIIFEFEGQKGCRTAIIDVTTQKHAESALRELNINLDQSLSNRTAELQESIANIKLFGEAIAHLREGVMFTRDLHDWPAPKITFVNNALCRLTGYTADELIGHPPSILHGDATATETLDMIKSELNAGRSAAAEWISYRKDGTPYFAEVFVTPLFSDDGKRTNFVSIYRDITKRKQDQAALHESEERLQLFVKHAPAALAMFDRDMHYLAASQRWLTDYAINDEDIVGRSHYEVFSNIPEEWRAVHRRGLAGEVIRKDEDQFELQEGGKRWLRWEVRPWYLRDGSIGGIIIFTEDITKLKKIDMALHDREERLRAVLNTAADAIINIDKRGIITDANPATQLLFGYTQNELIGQNVKILMPQPYRDEHDDYIARYLATGQPRIIGIGREVMGRRKDGSTFPVDLAVSEVDHLGFFTGVIRDISERNKLQREVVAIAEEEQQRIGQDLHDGTQQQLAGLDMLVQTLFERLTTISSPQHQNLAASKHTNPSGDGESNCDLTECLDITGKILKGIRRTKHDVRDISKGLVPIKLAPEGLMDALRELASRTEELSGVDCVFKCERPVMIGDSATATHLYRIAQEALANSLKHAHPTNLLIALDSENGQPILRIADDGIGIDPKAQTKPQSTGMGFKIMSYRASLIGANLTITPVETGGTLISCKLFGNGQSPGK